MCNHTSSMALDQTGAIKWHGALPVRDLYHPNPHHLVLDRFCPVVGHLLPPVSSDRWNHHWYKCRQKHPHQWFGWELCYSKGGTHPYFTGDTQFHQSWCPGNGDQHWMHCLNDFRTQRLFSEPPIMSEGFLLLPKWIIISPILAIMSFPCLTHLCY